MENRKMDRNFGWMVGRSIRRLIDEQIEKVNSENQRLKSKINKYQSIKELLAKLGFDPDSFWDHDVYRRIQAEKCLPQDLKYTIERTKSELDKVLQAIESIKTTGGA
jgi:prefoldin subunit 5